MLFEFLKKIDKHYVKKVNKAVFFVHKIYKRDLIIDDADKEIPAHGFGARVIKGKGQKPSHSFALNGDMFNPECNRVDGVLAAYENCINKCQLYGPTNFAELISAVNARSEAVPARQEEQTYQILLIITDGVITDMEATATIDELVRCSEQPMSVIIVGVGNADFHKMNSLDAD